MEQKSNSKLVISLLVVVALIIVIALIARGGKTTEPEMNSDIAPSSVEESNDVFDALNDEVSADASSDTSAEVEIGM